MAKNLRSGVTDNYSYVRDQNVSVWMPHLKKWHGGFRFLNDSGGNAVVGRGHRLLKAPLQSYVLCFVPKMITLL